MVARKLMAANAILSTVIALVIALPTSQAAASPTVGNIPLGSSNHHGVWCVQAGINHWWDGPLLAEDGVFGEKTLDAVRYYQASHGIATDVVVGPITGDFIWGNDGQSDYCYLYVPTTS